MFEALKQTLAPTMLVAHGIGERRKLLPLHRSQQASIKPLAFWKNEGPV
jgi:hypothetical protein